MKALIVVDSDTIFDILSFYMKPLGFDLIRYRNPLKAIDNLEEIMPDAIIMSARDFPRHWKPFIQVARHLRPKERCIFVLLKGELFPFDEAAKAMHLGVNGVIKEDLGDRTEVTRFQQLLKRYIAIEDARGSDRIVPAAWDRLDFIFNHPVSLAIISGRIETISVSGLSFKPDLPALVADLDVSTILEECSIRVGNAIVSCSCAVVRQTPTMAFRFVSIADKDRAQLEDYLLACPERQIKAMLKKV